MSKCSSDGLVCKGVKTRPPSEKRHSAAALAGNPVFSDTNIINGPDPLLKVVSHY